LAFEILSNPYYIWEKWTIDEKQMLLRLLFSKKILVDFSTKTYWTLPFSSLFLYTWDVFDWESCHLDLKQTLLNQHDMNYASYEDEIWKFYQFWLMLVRQGNLEKYEKYKYLLW
jgi:hypothetical protein